MEQYQKTYNELSKLNYKMDDMEGEKAKLQQELTDLKIEEYVSFIEEDYNEGNLKISNVRRYMKMLAQDMQNLMR